MFLLHFQELEGRTGANSRNSNVTSPNPFTVLLKIGVDSSGHVPSTRILDDDSVIPGFEYLAKPGGASSLHHEKESDCTVLSRSLRREQLPPGVVVSTCSEAFDPHAPEFIPGREVHPPQPAQLTTVRPLPTTPRSLSPVNDVHGHGPVHHDGTDYKRKCLQSNAINIQSLNLCKAGAGSDSLFIQASLGGGIDPKKKKMLEEHEHRGVHSPRAFMRAVSDRLSGHFGKDHKDHKEGKEKDLKTKDSSKGRSWGSSPVNSDKHDKFFSDKDKEKDKEKAPSDRRRMSMGSFTPSLSYRSSTSRDSNEDKESSAGRFLRPLSLNNVHLTTPADTSTAHFTAISQAKTSSFSPAPLSSIIGSAATVTPRSRSVSANGAPAQGPDAKDLRELNHHALLHAHNQNNNSLSHISLDSGGIAYVDSDNNSPNSATSRHGTGQPEKHHVSTPDALSHDSSWSNFSHNSTANSSHNNLSNLHVHAEKDIVVDKQEKQRIKYAALLHHYPHLFHCLLDPAVKIVAKRLNKFLKFKDELQKSLIRAEAVQESETVRIFMLSCFLVFVCYIL